MKLEPNALFKVWSPDQVAECLDGVDNELYKVLWGMVKYYEGKPRSECNDDFSDRALSNWWKELSAAHQAKLNELAVKRDEEYTKLIRGE